MGAPAPRKKGKQVVSEVSRRVKTGRGTPERGKASYSSGAGKCPPLPPRPSRVGNRVVYRRQQSGYLCPHKNKSCTNYCSFPSLCAILIKKRTRRYDVRTQYTDPRGGRLYAALEKELRGMGIQNMEACIGVPENRDEYLTRSSVHFHEHLGFRMVGEFYKCGFKFGRWYNMAWMEKHIGEHGVRPKVTWKGEM